MGTCCVKSDWIGAYSIRAACKRYGMPNQSCNKTGVTWMLIGCIKTLGWLYMKYTKYEQQKHGRSQKFFEVGTVRTLKPQINSQRNFVLAWNCPSFFLFALISYYFICLFYLTSSVFVVTFYHQFAYYFQVKFVLICLLFTFSVFRIYPSQRFHTPY